LAKRFKYKVNPLLCEKFHINVPPRYKTIRFSFANTEDLLVKSLLEEAGLPLDRFLNPPEGIFQIKGLIVAIADSFTEFSPRISQFNEQARYLIDEMFDAVIK